MSDSYSKIETRFGNIYVTATGEGHIFADANHNCASANLSEPDRHGPLTINTIQYGCNAHFYLWSDGAWHIGMESGDWSSRYHSLYGSKLVSKSYSDSHMTDAARAKFATEVTPLINTWALDNPHRLYAAAVESLETKVEGASAAVLEARSALALAEQALEAAEKELAAAKGGK
jgi:hypothetical protein